VRLILCALLLGPLPGHAGGVLESSVTYHEGVYSLSIEARIDAPVAMVYRLITDYDHLSDINPAIKYSRVLRTDSPVKHRMRSVTRVCVLFYCREVTQVQDMTQQADYGIDALILPQGSDFRRGRAHWRLKASGDATLMHFDAELVPDFYIPPLVGPWLIRREMVGQITEIIRIIEDRYQRRETP